MGGFRRTFGGPNDVDYGSGGVYIWVPLFMETSMFV